MASGLGDISPGAEVKVGKAGRGPVQNSECLRFVSGTEKSGYGLVGTLANEI